MVPQARPQSGELRVLVLEDEVLIRLAIAEELRAQGLVVIEAVNADEAWSYLKAGGHIDLVFTDVCMPGSMDGREFANRVRGTYPEIHIVMTSGQKMALTEEEVAHFLPKPYAFDQAARFVMNILNSKNQQTF
ncbi:MAG TPA: response regulator [Methylovirgula sp.]|jgi:CheY-like chemotaxis protein|nr:response regulator [Methylovirgula sp.]